LKHSTPKRICISGPESTGKSYLANKLSDHFSEPFVPEAARDYLESLSRTYIQSDLDEMLKMQLAYEKHISNKTKNWLICDTGPEVFWVWSMYKYGSVSSYIANAVKRINYDVVFLMNIDLPWEEDTHRENPNLEERKEIFDMYVSLLSEQGTDFKIISGSNEERFKNVLQHLLSYSQA